MEPINMISEIDPGELWHFKKSDQLPRFKGDTKGGWDFEQGEVGLYVAKKQMENGGAIGFEILSELATCEHFGVQVLKLYLYRTSLIPPEWNGNAVVFWGHIYRSWDGKRGDSPEELYVHYLYCDGDLSYRGYRWLGDRFGKDSPAAIHKKLVLAL